MMPIKQIRQHEWHHRGKKMATRSREKEIGERNCKHCAGEHPPGSTALEKHQNTQKRCYCVKHITCERDQKSASRALHSATPPHGRASAAIQRKYSAHHITAHSSYPDDKEQKPKRPDGNQNLFRSKRHLQNSRTLPAKYPTYCNGCENAESD